jgi:hypothetical protein
MVDDTKITSPLGHSDHCVITFKFRCYFEQINTSTERWNFFKGNYDLMRNEMNIDWDNYWWMKTRTNCSTYSYTNST